MRTVVLRRMEEALERTAGEELLPGEVHVWFGHLEVLARSEGDLAGVLSMDERERAARFRFARDRQWFVLRRGALRSVLARYSDRGDLFDPSGLRFIAGPWGKPELPRGPRFSQSASDRLTLIAVAEQMEVGVDIERIRPGPDLDLVVARAFTPGEAAALRALPRPCREERFFAVWTRKEAFAKAMGLGLSMRFDAFEAGPEPMDGWSLEELPAPPGYRAALCVAPTTG